MAGELVFITGATGHIGFAVLVDALKAGYRVRASVRREEQAEELKNHPDVKSHAEKLDFIVVPDITVDGAFDKGLEGVTYIEHIASPLPKPDSEDPQQDVVVPALKGTTSILYSALKVPTIRRIVITSSGVAVIPRVVMGKGDRDNVYTPYSRVNPLPSEPWEDVGAAYGGSKVLALDAAERFIAEKKPHFTIVHIMPTFVVGPNKLVKDPAQVALGSNGVVMGVILGSISPAPRPGTVCDLGDVARAHVESLDENKVQGNKNFIIESSRVEFDDAAEIAKKHFPEAVKDGRLPLGGSLPSVFVKLDTSETTKTFGPLKTYEESVVSLLEYYLELKAKS